MSTDLERADRNLMSLLADAGVHPGQALGLTYRLLLIDAMTAAEVAAFLGISESTVRRRVERVLQLLRGAPDPGDPDDPETDASPLVEEACAILEAWRNATGGGGSEKSPLICDPLISIRDVVGILREAERRREKKCVSNRG